jgi:imidazolonepropionase
MRLGTGAIEIGLWINNRRRIKMLRVINNDSTNYPISIKVLGAHAIPLEYKEDRKGYRSSNQQYASRNQNKLAHL